MTVEGQRLLVHPGVDTNINVTVAKRSGAGLFTDLSFSVFYREIGEEGKAWQLLELHNSSSDYTVNAFIEVELRPSSEDMTFTSNNLVDVEAPFKGFRGRDLEYGFFVYPFSGWGSLEGEYPYRLEVR